MANKEQDPELELIDIHPVDSSMLGANTFYQFCHNRQQQVSYAVCLHTLKAIDEDRMAVDQFTDCQRGYARGDCYAAKMRKTEQDAGHALYFVPRVVRTAKPSESAGEPIGSSGKYDMQDASYARGWAIGGGSGENLTPKKRKPATPPPKAKPKTSYVEEGMADVVNSLIEDSKKPAAVKLVAKPVVVEPKPKAAATAAASPTRPLPGESTADFIKRRALLKAGK